MQPMESILTNYDFHHQDEEHLHQLAELLLPIQDKFAKDFYKHLMQNDYTATFFQSPQAVRRREETIMDWLRAILTSKYDHRLLMQLTRIGEVHVKIGLEGHYVNSAMSFIRRYFQGHLVNAVADPVHRDRLLETLDKVLDISLDVMTGSYREAELKKVFLSQRVEFWLVKWSERLMHGLNLILMIGLVALSLGVAALLGTDILFAFQDDLEIGVIKSLGSLLILWMMIELLHTQVHQLKGGKFNVRIFVDLAMVAFIRKVFVATIESKDPLSFGLLLAGLLILGLIYFLIGRSVNPRG